MRALNNALIKPPMDLHPCPWDQDRVSAPPGAISPCCRPQAHTVGLPTCSSLITTPVPGHGLLWIGPSSVVCLPSLTLDLTLLLYHPSPQEDIEPHSTLTPSRKVCILVSHGKNTQGQTMPFLTDNKLWWSKGRDRLCWEERAMRKNHVHVQQMAPKCGWRSMQWCWEPFHSIHG